MQNQQYCFKYILNIQYCSVFYNDQHTVNVKQWFGEMFKTKDIYCKESSSLIRLIKSNRDLLKSIPKCTMPIDSRSNVNF